NPVISIGPILETRGIRAALEASPAPKVAVSPLVHGEVVKGPTSAFLQWTGQPASSDGIAGMYANLIDGLVADEPSDALPVCTTDVLMSTADARRRVAAETLEFALTL
ncbi:MAG: 2-phospho-L-lactate transferase CofD family protein, partial [Acidobacteriota bacterium]